MKRDFGREKGERGKERKGRRGKRGSFRKREWKKFRLFSIIDGGGRSGCLKQRNWAGRARERKERERERADE